jgi:hypothetical protein
MSTRREFLGTLAASSLTLGAKGAGLPIIFGDGPQVRVRSRKSGAWSSPATWESNAVPAPGSIVQISPGHNILYDVKSERAIRMVHILGTLVFARDRDTRLDVGLLKIGGDALEDGANCGAHEHGGDRPALEIGTPDEPIPAQHIALIRLVYFDGFDRDSLPGIVCCGGRMDFHGAPMSRTWLKLGAPVKKGDREIKLAEPVTGWRRGDRVMLTSTHRHPANYTDSTRDTTETEEHLIVEVRGLKLVLDQPADYEHVCNGPYSGEVANLSRNVIVESAQPNVERGHTMYHRGSAGSISYAEFRKLGKKNVLGRYSVHFHLVRDSMRGASVVGASIWDSDNRWITVHGTDYLVVRDCVGYNSLGHGFFLEDGTEVFNVFDRNLAVQGRNGQALPDQVLPFDHNSGSGFWWANSLNTFTRNVACECDVYGFRFDMQKTKKFDPVLSVPQSDGSKRKVDVRTLPFVRFEDNEAHCQRNFAFNLNGLNINLDGGCGGVGPDVQHPFIVRNMRVWDSHWSFHTLSPSVMLENYDIHDCAYGLWKPYFKDDVFHNVHMEKIAAHTILDASGDVPRDLPWEKDAGMYAWNIAALPEFDLELPRLNAPNPLDPKDDLPPVVIATYVGKPRNGQISVRGTSSDVGAITRIAINGHSAKPLRPNFAEWEVTIPAAGTLVLYAQDDTGNVTSIKIAG